MFLLDQLFGSLNKEMDQNMNRSIIVSQSSSGRYYFAFLSLRFFSLIRDFFVQVFFVAPK